MNLDYSNNIELINRNQTNNSTINDNDFQKKIQELLQKNSQTTLLAWFKLNQEDPEARQYLYRDIPKY
jgi:hypothetical protein